MKNLLNKFTHWYLFTCLVTLGTSLALTLLAIWLGAGDSLKQSVRGWHGGQVMFIMFGLPLVWASILMWFDWAVDKLNSKV
jgi:hypothetical protein